MNFKRKKCKRSIRCSMCTQYRWMGNAKEHKRVSDLRNIDKANSYEYN